jgi:Putative DNA-binding domain
MSSLVDLQARMRRAVTTCDPGALTLPLVGGTEPGKRLAIHQRHYEASLTTALREKFPATVWLLGEDLIDEATRGYVRTHPPRRPCIAEYGENFPAFLSNHVCAADLLYVPGFADLEWHLGQVSVAVDRPAMPWSDVVQLGSEGLMNAHVLLQPGLRFLYTRWAIDHLMTAYLTDSAPDTFVLDIQDIHIEIRGARGALQFERVDPATFAFRSALLGHRTLGDAAESALERDPDFDAGRALAALVSVGLVTDVAQPFEGTS